MAFDVETFYQDLVAAPDFETRLERYVTLPDAGAWEELCAYGHAHGGREWIRMRLQFSLLSEWDPRDAFPGERVLKTRLAAGRLPPGDS